MTWGSWGTWGEYWALFCIGVAIAAMKAGDLAGWWIFLLLAAVFGYIALNVLQKQLEKVEVSKVYDQEQDEDPRPEAGDMSRSDGLGA